MADFVGASNRTAATVEADLGDGRYRLSAGTAQGIEAHGPAGLAAGAEVALIVRPERLQLGDSGYPATVADVSYLGPSRTVWLDCEQLGRLQATVGGDVDVEAGRRLSVSWPAEAAWIVP